MTGKSNIEWTEATWNPIVGCSIKSPGCTNCYAMRDAWRKNSNPNLPRYHGLTKQVNGRPVWTGELRMAPDSTLLKPLKTRKPTTYFVNSMGDLFHEDVPDEWIDKVFAVMALSPQHTFQVLTKRAARMRKYLDPRGPGAAKRISRIAPNTVVNLPLPNVWLGVSTERQQEADERIPLLLDTPAAVRFISAEPLLGPIDLTALNLEGVLSPFNALTHGASYSQRPEGGRFYHSSGHSTLDWVIVGGESGPGARPMHPDWALSLRDQCEAAGVPFFFKQWGEHVHATQCDLHAEWPWQQIWLDQDTVVGWVGKKRAGRLLDGVEHNGLPHTGEGNGFRAS